MDQKEFLSALEARLAGLPEAGLQSSLNFYAEMLDDLTEGGLCEIHTTGGDIRVTIEE